MNLNDLLSYGQECEKDENNPNQFTVGSVTVRRLNGEESEEMASVLSTGPLVPDSSYMGGETGLAGKDSNQGSYLGKPSNQFTNSDGTL